MANTLVSLQTQISNHKFKRVLSQICAVLVVDCLLMSFGMIKGFPTILIPHISGSSSDDEIHLDEEGISWIGSIGFICTPIGSLISGISVNIIGRKRSMQLACVPFLLCSIVLKYSADAWQIYLALAICGFACGLLEAPILTYIPEVVDPNLRGVLSCTFNFAFVIGTTIEFILGRFLSWRDAMFVSGVGPLVIFFLLFLIPETPHWLIQKERFDDAKKSLAWFRGWTTVSDIEQEFQEILHQKSGKACDVENNNALYKYTRRDFIIPLALGCFIFFILHFNGSATLQVYAVEIFATLQAPINEYEATIFLGCAYVLGGLLCIALIRYLGKRKLIFCSLILASVCVILVATFAHIRSIYYFNANISPASNTDMDNYRWLPLTLLMVFAFATYLGMGTIIWIVLGEIFSTTTSHIGTGVCVAVSYVFNFLANKVFLSTVSHFTLSGTFWFYGAVGIFGFMVLYFWLPETEGHTLQEITNHFSGVTKLDNKVQRKHTNTMELDSDMEC